MKKAKLIYWVLLVLINVFAFLFLRLISMASFTMSPEARNPLNEQEVLTRLILYGVLISLFFSLISFAVSIMLKKKLSFDWTYLKRFFVIQFFLLVLVYGIIYFYIYH
jgi:hypothetical protein